MLLKEYIIDTSKMKYSNIQVVLGGMSHGQSHLYESMIDGNVTHMSDLDVDIEEADICIIPHALHAAQSRIARIIVARIT